MKKIAFIYSGSSKRGGLDTYFKLLFENYSKDKFDFRFVSLGRWATSQSINDNGGNVFEIKNHRFSPISLIKTIKYLKKEKIDLIVTAGMLSNIYGRKAALFTGIPVLTTVHSNYRYDYPNYIRRTIYYISDRILRFKTNHYIVVSNYLRENLISSGVKKGKITTIYNGIEFKDAFKKSHNGIIIGSVGRLHKTKGFDILIESMRELPSNVSLKIWGEGDERNNLEKIIRDNGLGKRVSLEGFTDNVGEALSEVDIYVQSSRMEGFGLATAEAMAAGLPVVVTPVGSLPELVEDGKTGLISNNVTSKGISEKVKVLVKDKNLCEKLGKNASEDVKKRFGVFKWIGKMDNIILETTK